LIGIFTKKVIKNDIFAMDTCRIFMTQFRREAVSPPPDRKNQPLLTKPFYRARRLLVCFRA